MDDTLRVWGVQCVRDLDAQIEQGFDLQRLASDPMTERLEEKQIAG